MLSLKLQLILPRKHRLDWEKYALIPNVQCAELSCTWLASSLHSVHTGLLILQSFYIIPNEQSSTDTLDLWLLLSE